ncbi:MAG: aminomethyl-transferring glycine dehydrogenase subunit GcvPB [Clostridia bacterium]|nr:aminomethyl-transferring glycine dehydrogenase subunit GcvPB [Clostridia bacterium]
MQLIFEKSVVNGRRALTLPEMNIAEYKLPEYREEIDLPEVAEIDVVRHYTGLSKLAHGVDDGFYPLGSCTMKYNPKLNEAVAAFEGFTAIHPTQPKETVRGWTDALNMLSDYLCEITGMDAITLQPAAGAHGEFTGMQLIKAYHKYNKDFGRKQILVPDSAHGTNPASANMCGFEIVTVPSNSEGGVDIEALKTLVCEKTAGLMLTNPNTVGLFDRNITEICEIVHKAGGLMYYDGANLNAVMGICRPGDMGFDVVHLNLHKTFSAPHGGGGPGCGPVGCKKALCKFLPLGVYGSKLPKDTASKSIGKVKSFGGNFLVALRSAVYIVTLGADGLLDASELAVLNANYLLALLKDKYPVAYDRICMHEFVLTAENIKHETGVSALDISKALLDFGIHPPTMYFPLIVHEALMFEPTETESKETLEYAADAMLKIYDKLYTNPQELHDAPISTAIGRVDEVQAARHPVLKYNK